MNSIAATAIKRFISSSCFGSAVDCRPNGSTAQNLRRGHGVSECLCQSRIGDGEETASNQA
jgi:hypothetical protein